MDFDGRSFRVGPDCARASTTVGEVAPRKWRVVRRRMCQRVVGAPGVSTSRAPDPDAVQDAANQRVIKVEAALRAMGDYDGPEVATLKFAEGQSSFQEQTDSGSNCGDRGIHFSCPETVVSSGRGTRAPARFIGQSIASPRTVAARIGERTRGAAVHSSGRLSAAPQVGGHCCRTQEGTRRFAAESGGAPRR